MSEKPFSRAFQIHYTTPPLILHLRYGHFLVSPLRTPNCAQTSFICIGTGKVRCKVPQVTEGAGLTKPTPIQKPARVAIVIVCFYFVRVFILTLRP